MKRHVLCASQARVVSRPRTAFIVAVEFGRTRFFIAVVIAVATFAWASPVHAQPERGNAPVYLALGDSYPYGSSPSGPPGGGLFDRRENGQYIQTNENFHVGYPEYLSEIIDLPVINAACPDDVSTSFLLYPNIPPTTGRLCRRLKEERPDMLHVDYSLYTNTWAQMDYAENFLIAHPRVRLITLQTRGQFQADLIVPCRKLPQPEYEACVLALLPAHEQTLGLNLITILSRIRGTGYSGPLIFVEYPATDMDSFEAGILQVIFDFVRPIVSSYGGEMAPVWERFRTETQPFGYNSCAAGLLITTAGGICNIHPTAAGHQLIANVIAEMPTVAGLK